MSPTLPDDDATRAAEIEARVDRLRRLRGWTDDTQLVPAMADEPAPAPRADLPTLVLRFADPELGLRDVEVAHDHFEIGSGESAHLRLMLPSISAKHCRINREPEGYRVRDLRSQGGTFVNDEAVPLSHPLCPGDRLRLGELLIDVDTLHPVEPGALSAPSRPHSSEAPAHHDDADAGVATLRWFEATGAERQAEVHADHALIVGRRPDADIRIDDKSVSGRHAVFLFEGSDLVVRDLGSTNGTFVGPDRVSRRTLGDGDVVRLGLVALRVALGADRPDAATHAAPPATAPRAARYHLVYANERGLVRVVAVGPEPDDPAMSFGDTCRVTYEDGALRVDAAGLAVDAQPAPTGSAWVGAGQVVTTDELRFQVVAEHAHADTKTASHAATSGAESPRAAPLPPANDPRVPAWRAALGTTDPELEVLCIDASGRAGGRRELCLWGDGLAEVDLWSDGTKATCRGKVCPELVRLVLVSLAAGAFPDGRGLATRGIAPEIDAYAGTLGAKLVVGDGLAAQVPPLGLARDLLRAIAAEVAGPD